MEHPCHKFLLHSHERVVHYLCWLLPALFGLKGSNLVITCYLLIQARARSRARACLKGYRQRGPHNRGTMSLKRANRPAPLHEVPKVAVSAPLLGTVSPTRPRPVASPRGDKRFSGDRLGRQGDADKAPLRRHSASPVPGKPLPSFLLDLFGAQPRISCISGN